MRTEAPHHRKVKHGTEAKLLTASSPSQCRALSPAANAAVWQTNNTGPPPQNLNTKQAEILRFMFSIALTGSVSVVTFLAIRHLIGLSEFVNPRQERAPDRRSRRGGI